MQSTSERRFTTHVASGTLSESSYIRAIASFTIAVAAIVAIGAKISYTWQMSWILLIASFAIAVISIFIFTSSDTPMISFIGVSTLSAALGIMMGPLVSHYKAPIVIEATILTSAIMIIMSVAGILAPKFFRGWGPYLLGGLTILIIAQFAQIILIFCGFKQATHMPFLTWIGITIFVGFVAYDWARALEMEYTLDNAIDVSGGLILDAVNLFIRFLSVIKSDD